MSDITHVVSFSGGRSSRLLVHLMEIKRKEENLNVEYIFMDTGAEHPETYKFIRDVVEFYGIELTCLKAKFGPKGVGTTYQIIPLEEIKYDLSTWEAMIEKYSTPYNPGGTFCTDQMKGIPSRKYLKDKYPKGNYIQWWGIRCDEPKRLTPKHKVRYLAELSSFEKEDVIEWSKSQEVDLNIEHSDITGNCVFCIKRSINKVALAAKLEPELATDFINLIESPLVREIEDRKADKRQMYRGQQSLISIMNISSELTVEQLKQQIKGMRQYDSGSCSESCEAINSEGDSLTAEMLEELIKEDLEWNS